MAADIKIRRALISVYDKTGVADFARALHDEFGIEIISTGGTAKILSEAGVAVTLVEDITGFPEMLDGRVKTLHPKIHAAILADRDNSEHMRQLKEAGIEPIDMVVVNLYPFEKTVADPDCTFEQAIEMIDIGGPCLLRAAAKSVHGVLVVPGATYFRRTLRYLRGDTKSTGTNWPEFLRTKAFQFTATYEIALHDYFGRKYWQTPFLPAMLLDFTLNTPTTGNEIRYGENPHQEASIYCSRHDGLELGGGDDGSMSFNNYADANAALELCAELTRANSQVWHRFVTGGVRDRKRVAARVAGERLTERNLPHFQKPEATYFITFRVKTGELAPDERDVVLAACRYWHERKMTLHAATVMPDHVHLLLTPHQIEPNHWVSLGEILHSIKRYSAREVNLLRGVEGTLWQDESFDRIVRDEREFVEKWEYIEANPITARIADGPGYRWFWKSDTGFMEAASVHHRLQTGATQTGATQTGATQTGATQTGATQTGAADSGATGAGSVAPVPVCLLVKHTNACGVGVGGERAEAYRQAYLGDPNAAMGGILAVNFDVDAEFAAMVMETYQRLGKPLKEAGHPAAPGAFFIEVWVAPSFDEEAVRIIRGTAEPTPERPDPPKKKWGKRVRLLDVGDMAVEPDADEMDIKKIAGGLLMQTRDLVGLNEDQWKVATEREPSEREMADLRLAWLVCKHTKSNAISLCRDGMLIGNGVGQMSRVMSCRIATWLARENGHVEKLPGSAAASDAFFPFRDGPGVLIDAGVTAIIQPGGSKRDDETIAACNERDVAMIFTGTRHFKH